MKRVILIIAGLLCGALGGYLLAVHDMRWPAAILFLSALVGLGYASRSGNTDYYYYYNDKED